MSEELPILVEVRRGAIVESRHCGAIVAVEPDGTVAFRLGDSGFLTSTRSTIKPFQAIPFITTGAADHFGISERELALTCASHEGEPFHVERVAGMLARAGLDESALRCGAHPPFNGAAVRQLENEGQPFTQLHNNCSGKHTGMLLTAVYRGLELDDYYKPEHPVQREIASVLTRIASLEGDLPTAIDGCSAPTFGVPLRSLALAFARLVNPDSVLLGPEISGASTRIVRAMIAHPEMVGGTKRFDSDLLRAGRGKLVCKIGAEAVYGIGVLPCERYPRGLGIALKIEDGSQRGLGPAVVETLAQLGVLSESEQAELAAYHRPSFENRRGLIVGEARAVFDLGSH
ncbi:MAG: asparaginase [Acidobacteriota bacterium]